MFLFSRKLKVGLEWCRLQRAPHLPDAASIAALHLVAVGLRQAVDARIRHRFHPVYRVVLTELDIEASQDYSLEVEQ